MTYKRFKLNKLIRDKIPELLRSQGVIVHEHKIPIEEFIPHLKNKLIEESKEVKQTESKEDLIEEIADLLEVVDHLVQSTGLKRDEIEQVRLEKIKSKGGFEKRIFNSYVEIQNDNPLIHNFHQYPEIGNPQSSCIFCQFGNKEKVFASFKHCFVIKDQFPVSKGHLLIIPYEHTANWFTASEDVKLEIIQVLEEIKERLDKEYNPDGYNIGANCGQIAGQTVMHLHVHLIPRYKGDMADPKGGVRGVIPEKQKY